jgi:protein SEY1
VRRWWLTLTKSGYNCLTKASLPKPAGKEDALITDYFDFSFQGLPHKVYAFDNFKAGVNGLQSRFYDSVTPDFLLKPNYHKGVPADGFPRFAEAIWEKIVSNRDLDLPTQQQLLAQYRCDEISKVLAFKLGCVQSFYFEYK